MRIGLKDVGVMTTVKRLGARMKWLLSLVSEVYIYLRLYNLDGTPRVHVRRNGSRYIYPEALFKSHEFQQAMGLKDTRDNPGEKAKAG